MKAIINASSDGRQLRPLTCTNSPAMIKIAGKPILGYMLELLDDSGFDEIAVICDFNSDIIEAYIESAADIKAKVYCVEKGDSSLYGIVRPIAEKWNESFVAAECNFICDINIGKAMLYHNTVGADVTVICTSVEESERYRIVNLNRNGTVESLFENPEWYHTSSNLANTGIYIVNPEIISAVSDNTDTHFLSDSSLQLLLEKRKKIYGYQTDSYWHCIDDVNDIRYCSRDILTHRVNAETAYEKNGIFASDGIPDGDYTIIPPVMFGKNVKIGNGCTIGPFTVIDDNISVGSSARIKKSCVMAGTQIGANCDIIGSVIGQKCIIKRNSVCLEGSCIGDRCSIESGSTVANNVSVWPEKRIGSNTVLTHNLRDGSNHENLIRNGKISGNTFTEITCEKCCRIGEALGSSSLSGKIAVGYAPSRESSTLAMSILSGLISSGNNIFDFGECFESQMQFFVSFCMLDSGIYISADKNTSHIRFFGNYGLPVTCRQEKELENIYKKSDFRRIGSEIEEEIRDMSFVGDVYYGHLLSMCGDKICDTTVSVKSFNERIMSAVEKCFYLLGATNTGKPSFSVDYSGSAITATDENSVFVSHEKLLMLCSIDCFERGEDICIPFEAPAVIERLAEKYGCSVIRTGSSHIYDYTEKTGLLARRCMWAYDGLSLLFTVMGIMKKKELTLAELSDTLPAYGVCSSVLSCDIPHSRLSDVLDIRLDKSSAGVRKELPDGVVTFVKQDAGRCIRIIAEADTMEAAAEICADVQRKINRDAIDNMTQ